MGVIFDSIIYDLQSHGGVSVYFSEILKRIINDDGIDDNLYLSSGNKSSILLEQLGANNIIKLSERILERYRDVDFPSNESSSHVFHSSYYRLPSERKMPIITTVHDFTYEKFVKGLPLWVHSWQKRRAVECSDLIICVSENTAQDLMQFCKVPENKIRVVHNGVSENYSVINDVKRKDTVLFVGARGGYKNFHLAVAALKQVPDVQLRIVGGGNLSAKELFLLEKNIPGRFHWLGRLSDQELNIEYNSSLCLLYPSSYEGFGIPILEAMRAGCPVIAVNASSIPEVAGNACILLDEPKSELIVDAISIVRKGADKLRQAGFTQASKFSWDACYHSTKDVYHELI